MRAFDNCDDPSHVNSRGDVSNSATSNVERKD